MIKKTIFRNDTKLFKFTFNDQDGDPVDLSLASPIIFMAKENTNLPDTDAIFNKTCTITDAANGKCEAKLLVADTAVGGRFIAEVQGNFDSDTDITTLVQFELIISEDVIQATT